MNRQKQKRNVRRHKRAMRVRRKLTTNGRPRLSVHKSNQHLSVQIIDDETGSTLAAISTNSKELRGTDFSRRNRLSARKLGERIAEMAKKEQQQQEKDSELSEKVLHINRCAKVVKGGRKFSFSALILAGDGKGRVGFGFAKANELTDAIRKGSEAAKKNMLEFEHDGSTIPHEVLVRWDGARVLLKPAPEGTGVIAGSHVRAVLEMAGVRDVVAKSLGCSNPINLVRATFRALNSLRNLKNEKMIRETA